MPDQSISVSPSGYLTVEEGKVFQERFCCIDTKAKSMNIYTDDPMIKSHKAVCLKTIDFKLVSMAQATGQRQSGPKHKYENCFSITSLGDEHVFKARSSEEMQKWIEIINNECKVTVPRRSMSLTSSEGKESEEGGYSMSVVAGVLHKTLVEDIDVSSDIDTDDDLMDYTCTLQYSIRPAKIIKSGYAVKQGYIMKNWKRRFFILDDEGVSYFANEQASKPIRIIPRDSIIEARPSVGIHPNRDNLLELVTKERVFYLQVEWKEDVTSWISAINNYVYEKKDSIRNAEVQTTDSLPRNASLPANLGRQAVQVKSQSTASQTTDFLRKKQSVKTPLPDRIVQSYSTYL
ncbi:pleckstrin homology domain-containing family A member 1-like isoform X2 [Lineus longissimus]|uniref:pleckstrin homology domain-containing family A member 1-like isoform X2 n=1 Tax=Lineus longissimus TaxID=88925 RepID=UPI002B4C4182